MPDTTLHDANILLLPILAVFNLAAFLLIRKLMNAIDLRQALSEKAGPVSPQAGTAAAILQAATSASERADTDDTGKAIAKQLAAIISDAKAKLPEELPPDTSYSRVTGMLGAVVIICIIWAVGNVWVVKAMTDPTNAKTLLDDIWPFILSSASLFLPYGLNMFSKTLKDGKTS